MPGLVGIISGGPPGENRRFLKIMIDSLMHEPSYRSAQLVEEKEGLYIGSVSHAGTFDDGLPVFNEKGDIGLMFSGEAFDDPPTIRSLEAKGHSFPRPGAAYLVHLYEDIGESFFEKLNGWFSGVLVDRRTGTASLFNDRYGMKRLYYFEDRESLYFASEAKAILNLGLVPRSFDAQALSELAACGCPLENRSLFRHIRLLPAGSRWVARNKKIVERTSYVRFSSWEGQERLAEEDFYPKLRETFRRILPRYLNPAPSIGLSLTGGLDTRMIMANAAWKPRQMTCYTFNGMYRDCYDVKLARKIARVCGLDHETITLDESFLKNFRFYAEKTISLSEGTIDLNAAPDLFTSARARRIGLVRLSGNYGSEVLRQVQWLRGRAYLPPMISADLYPGIIAAEKRISELGKMHPLTYTLLCDAPWHEYGRYAVESSQVVQRTPYLDNDLVALIYQAPPGATSNKSLSIRLIADGNPALTRFPTDRGVPLNNKNPFRTVVREYTEGLFKAEYLFNYGAPQWLAKTEHYVPFLRLEKFFLGRHKFYHFRRWYRDDLSSFVKETLLDPRTLRDPVFNAREVEKMVAEHTRGIGNHTNGIHLLLQIALTRRLILEG